MAAAEKPGPAVVPDLIPHPDVMMPEEEREARLIRIEKAIFGFTLDDGARQAGLVERFNTLMNYMDKALASGSWVGRGVFILLAFNLSRIFHWDPTLTRLFLQFFGIAGQ